MDRSISHYSASLRGVEIDVVDDRVDPEEPALFARVANDEGSIEHLTADELRELADWMDAKTFSLLPDGDTV